MITTRYSTHRGGVGGRGKEGRELVGATKILKKEQCSVEKGKKHISFVYYIDRR